MTTVQLTKGQVHGMNYSQLVHAAAALGIATAHKKKDQLVKLVASKINRSTARKLVTEVSAEMKKIISNKDMSKSDKMRALFNAGMPIVQIAHELDTYYSFVLGAVQRKQKDAE